MEMYECIQVIDIHWHRINSEYYNIKTSVSSENYYTVTLAPNWILLKVHPEKLSFRFSLSFSGMTN